MSALSHRWTKVLLAPLLFASGLGNAGAAAPADVLRYGIDDVQNINRLSQEVALREGFFTREGLRVEIVNFTSTFRTQAGGVAAPGASPATVRAGMDAGTVDMSRQQLPLLVNDALTGRVTKNYVGVALSVSNPVYALIVRPEIRSYADLKGKVVTATGLSDGITLWTQELITRNGLRNEDFTIRSIAGTAARFDCMKSGECVAAPMAQPAAFDALDAGYHALGLSNEIAPLLYQVDIVNPDWARTHRAAVVKYIRATAAANRFIMDPANRERVVRITMDYMKEPENRSRQMLGYIWDPKNRVLAQRPELDLANVRATIALMGKYGAIKGALPPAERFADASYVEAAR